MAFGSRPPFGGNLLPPGALGGNIDLGLGGAPDHVSIFRDGSHVSYDLFRDGRVTGVHGEIHRIKRGGPHTVFER